MKPLLQLISDDTGAPSVMRLCFLFIVLVIVGVWAVLCIRSNSFVPIPAGAISLLSVITGGKVLQSFSENFSQPPTPNTTTP